MMPSPKKLGKYGSGFNQTRTIFSIDGVCPTLWAGMGKDPPRILIPGCPDRCYHIATLDPQQYKQLEMHRRIYSTDAASPTIPTHSGGGNIPLIAVPIAKIGGFDSYNQHNYIYGKEGIAPTILRNCEKGYPPLILEGKQ